MTGAVPDRGDAPPRGLAGAHSDQLVDAVAAAALSCPEVARLSGGTYGQVATYLPRRRVVGVRLQADRVEVHVVGWYGASVQQITKQVRAAVRPYVGDHPIDVHLDDLEERPEERPQERPIVTEPGSASTGAAVGDRKDTS